MRHRPRQNPGSGLTADEPAIGQTDSLLGVEGWALARLSVGDPVAAQVPPRVDLWPPPRTQLRSGEIGEVGADVAGHRRDDESMNV